MDLSKLGDPEPVEPLDGRPLADSIEYVATRSGWEQGAADWLTSLTETFAAGKIEQWRSDIPVAWA